MKVNALSALLACTLAAPSAAAPEQELKATDHKKLAKEVAAYFEARRDEEGIAEALESVNEAIGKLGKKLKGRSVLALVDDLEEVLYLAQDYGAKRLSKGKGRVTDMEIDHFFGTLEVAIHAPKKYDGKKGPYSLLLSIPDEGEDPSEHLTEDWADADARENTVIVALQMPEKTEAWTELGEQGAPGGIGTVMGTLGWMTQTVAIDMDRIFISGSGRGVATAAHIANLFPHVFAGVIGRGGDLADDFAATNFLNLPTYFSGGGGNCTDFEKAAEEAGFGNCVVKPDGSEADLWAWMAEQSRNAIPSQVAFAPTEAISNSAYWVQLEAFEPDNCVFTANVDRESNTIDVTAEGVSNIRIYFNDRLVDMDQPVTVRVNGTEHKEKVPRNFQVMLSNAFSSGDTGRVFTNSVSYTVP